ncbi:hypothetical protein AGMMS4952_10790 [Spirochaetia bacterium]|nr:hypothetical protein AGMMS4952_10790 [Spirochaetia bacterium]
MKKIYESEQLMVLHQSAQALFDLGIIDTAEMRDFDEGCLVPQEKTSKKVPEVLEADHPATA